MLGQALRLETRRVAGRMVEMVEEEDMAYLRTYNTGMLAADTSAYLTQLSLQH